MNTLPFPGAGKFLVWRLDRADRAADWDSGEGAFQCGGRWNGRGMRTVYCSLDPATAILEVAVHKGFKILDTTAHVLTAAEFEDTTAVHIVQHADVPNPNWLVPGLPSAGQHDFARDLLRAHKFIAIPSVVSRHSWNFLFDSRAAAGAYRVSLQEKFALDTRLHPPAAATA